MFFRIAERENYGKKGSVAYFARYVLPSTRSFAIVYYTRIFLIGSLFIMNNNFIIMIRRAQKIALKLIQCYF